MKSSLLCGSGRQLVDEAPIFTHVFSNDVAAVRSVLAEDATQSHALDTDKRSPLHAAAYCNLPSVAEDLLEACPDRERLINSKDSRWLTALHRACRVNAHEVVGLLIKSGADPNTRDKNWLTPAHVAAANGAVESLKLLLECSINVNVGDRAGRTCLHLGAYNSHKEVCELLLKNKANVNNRDKKDRRALHWAVYWRSLDLVKLLLRHGADPNVGDKNGFTPLHAIATKPHEGLGPGNRRSDFWLRGKDADLGAIVQVLFEHGADARIVNCHGNTPIHTACLNFNSDCLNFLMKYAKEHDNGEEPITDITNNQRETPLHVAAGAIDSTDDIEFTTGSPIEMCLEILIERDKSGINDRNHYGRTPLHLACIHGCVIRVKILLSEGSDVDMVDTYGKTPLHLASENGHILVVEMLIQYKSNLKAVDKEGRTALHYGSYEASTICTKLLMSIKPEEQTEYLNLKDRNGMTCLHHCAYMGNVKTLDFLLESCIDHNALDQYGRSALHYGAAMKWHACVVSLIRVGCDICLEDSNGATPLHLACAEDMDGNVVEFLLEEGANRFIKDREGYTPLHYAAANGNTSAVMMLLRDGRPKQVTWSPTSTLYFAAAAGHCHILSLLMTDLFEDINACHRKTGLNPLHVAAANGRSKVCQLLVDQGASIFARDETSLKMTPLHHASKGGNEHCVHTLLEAAAEDVELLLKDRSRGKKTALMHAAFHGHTKACELLLKYKCPVNARDSLGRTALFMAAGNNQEEVCQLLLDNGADVLLHDRNMKTPVHVAAISGNVEVLCTLLFALQEIKVDQKKLKDKDDFTPLQWSALMGHESCVQFLLNKEDLSKEKTTTDPSFTPIHCTCVKDKLQCLSLLNNESECELDVRDVKGRTPLHVAALTNSIECLKFLLAQKAVELDTVDHNGQTPLMMAAKKGNVQIADLLISKGCDLSKIDIKGNMALHYGCMLKTHDVADVILSASRSKGLHLSAQNKDGQTPLHFAASGGLVSTTETLLSRGASVTLPNRLGLTPVLACAPNDSVVQCLGMMLTNLLQSRQRASMSSQDLQKSLGSSHFSESSLFNESEAEENHIFNNDTFTVMNGNDKTVSDGHH